MKAWLACYGDIDSAMNLYFAAKTGAHSYLNSRFLALAHALEVLHRRSSLETVMPESEFDDLLKELIASCPSNRRGWLKSRMTFANELGLRSRLKENFSAFHSHFGGKNEVKILINSIVDTRNYFTHYTKELEGKATQGKKLLQLCGKLELLFQLHLLNRIGFSASEIQEICQENRKIQEIPS